MKQKANALRAPDAGRVSRRRMLHATVVGTVGVGLAATRKAAAQSPTTLKMQSTWPTKDIFNEVFVDWGKKVEEMAGGRLKIDILPAGAVVPAFQLIEAVHQGTLDGGHGVPAYCLVSMSRPASLAPGLHSVSTPKGYWAGSTMVAGRNSTTN
jgi:TRAP-type mannitol/chloroaromatic compound transport system substrate-binding protein